jgi:hypothetical protein
MPRTYLDFDLLVERVATAYRARVTDSPCGEAAAEFQLPFSQLEIENFVLKVTGSVGALRRAARRLDSPERQLVRSFGGRLFQAVFSGAVQDVFQSSLNEAVGLSAGLRIRLHLGDTPELADLPWEFLYDPEVKQPVGLSGETALVRYVDLPIPTQPLAVSPPISMLVMLSSPADFPQLDVAAEWDRINRALGNLIGRGLVSLTRLQDATLASLQRPLRQRPYHIFHFVGHGGFDEEAQDGALVLENSEGRARLVTGQDLGVMLSGHHSLRLVVLNSCEGARASVSDPFSGIAESLVCQGIPAVVAMQFEISDLAAITFAQEFYAAIADGEPVDTAVGESRRAIFASGNDVEWATPVLYMRSPNGQLFELEDSPFLPGRPSPAQGLVPERTVVSDTTEAAGGRDGDPGSGGAPASLTVRQPPAPAQKVTTSVSPRRSRVRPKVWLAAGLVAVAGSGVLIATLASSTTTHPTTTIGTSISGTSHSRSTTLSGDISQGTARLSSPTQGFDLLTGRPVFFIQSSMAWDGNQLSIFDETTLGALTLGRVPFGSIGIATLRSLPYRRGAANPPLGLSDIPAGEVLAIHVAETAFAKVEILGVDSNDVLEFRWVTYGTTPG